MNARVLIAAVGAAAALFFACSGDHSGFYCPTDSFSSEDCTERITNAQCADGGTVEGSNDNLCCAWESCAEDPFPELHSGPN